MKLNQLLREYGDANRKLEDAIQAAGNALIARDAARDELEEAEHRLRREFEQVKAETRMRAREDIA